LLDKDIVAPSTFAVHGLFTLTQNLPLMHPVPGRQLRQCQIALQRLQSHLCLKIRPVSLSLIHIRSHPSSS
jgi:hypothetical protein